MHRRFPAESGPVNAAADYAFAPSERPMFPGSPYSPAQPMRRRLLYLATGMIIAIFLLTAPVSGVLAEVSTGSLSNLAGLFDPISLLNGPGCRVSLFGCIRSA